MDSGFSLWINMVCAGQVTCMVRVEFNSSGLRYAEFTPSLYLTSHPDQLSLAIPLRHAKWVTAKVGTCKSFFCVRIESRIASTVRFDFESNFRIESAIYTSEYLIHSIGVYFVFVTNESDARNWVLVIHFNSVLKRVKLCRCTII